MVSRLKSSYKLAHVNNTRKKNETRRSLGNKLPTIIEVYAAKFVSMCVHLSSCR